MNVFIPILAAIGLLVSGCVGGSDYTPAYLAQPTETPAPATPTTEPVEGPSIIIRKLVRTEDNTIVDITIPGGTLLEIGSGAFISQTADQVGGKFESTATFRITNISKKGVTLDIPANLGAFHTRSTKSLYEPLAPKKSIDLTITFHPMATQVSAPGRVLETITVAGQEFHLVGLALAQSGRPMLNVLQQDGAIEQAKVDEVTMGEALVPIQTRRAYFECSSRLCAGISTPTQCQLCLNANSPSCQLLLVNSDGMPIDEVTDSCQKKYPESTETSTLAIGGNDLSTIKPITRIVELLNTGTDPLIIEKISIVEAKESASKGEFSIASNQLAEAHSFEDYVAGKRTPLTQGYPLSTYEPPLSTSRLYIPIRYFPHDLTGVDGHLAQVGSPARDVAFLYIQTHSTNLVIPINGRTAIREVPSLNVFFKTSTGLKSVANGESFAFRGITATTVNSPVPMFINVAENASVPIRIVNVDISDDPDGHFEWLNTKAKIFAKPDGERCEVPILDAKGNQIDALRELDPVTITGQGFDIKPSLYTADSLPLFGCVNFHRDTKETTSLRQFTAKMNITAQELGQNGKPVKNNDGSLRETHYTIGLVAVIDPLSGRMVMRLTQTMAAIMNPEFPGLSAVSSNDALDIEIAEGKATELDRFVTLGSLILDPFDQETITTESGDIVTSPNDGITAVFRAIDTHPVSTLYTNPILFDYIGLIFDNTAPEGQRGIFFDYPNVPDDFQNNGFRIFTTTLSYPGPLAPASEKPGQPSQCEIVDPCTIEGQSKLGAGSPTSKAVCAFFNTSTGTYDSPAFETLPNGKRTDLCALHGGKQELKDLPGHYSLDGQLSFENVGIRMWGPTYFHSPAGPLASVPPLNEVFQSAFSTGTLLPPDKTPGHVYIPDPRINFSKQEHKINLDDSSLETPKLCPNNSYNISIRGQKYSSWRYFEPFMSKDEEGKTPAGCTGKDSPYDGGSAFIHGRPVSQENGVFSVAAMSKFSSNDDLTFAFKDVMIYIMLNGWVCDPTGSPDNFEGPLCYSPTFNPRDAESQISLLKKVP